MVWCTMAGSTYCVLRLKPLSDWVISTQTVSQWTDLTRCMEDRRWGVEIKGGSWPSVRSLITNRTAQFYSTDILYLSRLGLFQALFQMVICRSKELLQSFEGRRDGRLQSLHNTNQLLPCAALRVLELQLLDFQQSSFVQITAAFHRSPIQAAQEWDASWRKGLRFAEPGEQRACMQRGHN